MHKIKFILVIVSFASAILLGQVTAFKSGEKLSYSVTFSGSGISSNVMAIHMKTSTVKVKGVNLFKLYGDAVTYSNFDKVFKVRDFFESYVYPKSLEPVYFKRNTDENGHRTEEIYTFKRGKSTTATVGTKRTRKGRVGDPDFKGYSKNTKLSVSYKAKDIMSLLYYLRALPLSKINLQKGKSIKLELIFDAKVKPIRLKYQGLTTLNTAIGSKKCYKFTTSTEGDSNFISGAVYLTADANKVPVLIEANIPVGKGKITLTNAVGLKN